jgi:Abortive infection alpha
VGVWRSFAELAKPGAEIAHTQMELTNMSNELIRPIDPDTAHAIEETAKFGTKLLDSGDKAAGYAAGVVERLPHNLVGIIGDWVYHKRIRRWAELQAETKRILDERGVKEPYEDPSPSIALPLIEAAIDETRENLKEIWAKLLAAAFDPSRGVRLSFIVTLKQFEALDALVLKALYDHPGQMSPNSRDFLANSLARSSAEIVISSQDLIRLRCVEGGLDNFHISTYGHELMRVCSG